MSVSTISFVSHLAVKFPALEAAFAEHQEDNFGEVLPHLAMADFCRVICNASGKPDWIGEFLQELEENYAEDHDDDVSNLIAVSFIENLAFPSGNQVLTVSLPPKLKRQYALFFDS